MNLPVHRAQTMLRGDRFRNPRFTQQAEVRPSDRASIITGVMRADSPEGASVNPALPDIPFRYIIPADADAFDYYRINVETWRPLQSGESLWDLDFAPPPPPQPLQGAAGSGGIGLLGVVAGGVLLALALS